MLNLDLKVLNAKISTVRQHYSSTSTYNYLYFIEGTIVLHKY